MSTSHLRRTLAFTALLLFTSVAVSSATTLSGTVTNGTTGKPSAGDQVVLIKLSSGMEEVGHAKTDSQGEFSFNVENGNSPYLVRAIHQDVTYHTPAPPGTVTVDLKVYDVASKLDSVNVVADIMYVQAGQGRLGITRVFAVDNNSQPPRTEMNEAPFEFYMPDGAEIDEAQAQTAGGQPLVVSPTPQAQKGRYGFDFPLRPGQTQFQVTYHLNYSGKATIDPKLIYPLEHFVVIVPKSITFTPSENGVYQNQQTPNQPDALAAIVSNAKPGQKLAFNVSGEGMLQQPQEQQGGGGATAGDTRPGGGLGAPIDAPDPLDKYRVYILVGFGAILVGGAVFIVLRARSVKVTGAMTPSGAPAAHASVPAAASVAAAASPVGAASSGHGSMLLQGLKEELFQLELEHKQGKISDEDYAKTKAALDQTLARALKRKV